MGTSISSEWGQKGVTGDTTDASVWSFSRLCAMSVCLQAEYQEREALIILQTQVTLAENILLRRNVGTAIIWV